eukprot:403365998
MKVKGKLNKTSSIQPKQESPIDQQDDNQNQTPNQPDKDQEDRGNQVLVKSEFGLEAGGVQENHHKSRKSKKASKKEKKSKKSKKNKKRTKRDHDDYEDGEQGENEEQVKLAKKRVKTERDQGQYNYDNDSEKELNEDEINIRELEKQIEELKQDCDLQDQVIDQRGGVGEISTNAENNEEDQDQNDENISNDEADKYTPTAINTTQVVKTEFKKRIEIKSIPTINVNQAKSKTKKEEKMLKKLEEERAEQEKLKKYNDQQKEIYQKFKQQDLQKQQRRQNAYNNNEEDNLTTEVDQLIRKMKCAIEQDKLACINKAPAVFRLQASKECYNLIHKLPVQEKFLEQNGSLYIAQWLDIMPNGHFPNVNLVEGMLKCIDGIRFDEEHLLESNLGQILQYYSEGIAETNLQVKRLAKSILEKWFRSIYKIQSNYDQDLEFDNNYKEFQKKILKQKKQIKNQDDQESDDDAKRKSKKSESTKSKSKDMQNFMKISNQSTRNNNPFPVLLPERNAFDFTKRPERREEATYNKKKETDSGRYKIKRILDTMKKKNEQSKKIGNGFQGYEQADYS